MALVSFCWLPAGWVVLGVAWASLVVSVALLAVIDGAVTANSSSSARTAIRSVTTWGKLADTDRVSPTSTNRGGFVLSTSCCVM
eukprot:m.356235 g.356235  ORF g.356235 m.356235 type:complete len:84 (-) comp19929_c7_seq7:61-312(-)